MFAVAIPAFLFRLMSDFSRLPPVDARLLIAYFGGCLITYAAARVSLAARAFGMDGVAQSIFGMGTIFSNNVLLGIPLAKVTLGDASLPAVTLVAGVQLAPPVDARHRVGGMGAQPRGLAARLRAGPRVTSSPTRWSRAMLLGTAFGFTGLPLPAMAGETLGLISQAAVPMSLIVLGMGLAEYGMPRRWRPSLGAVGGQARPRARWSVYVLARALALPLRETQAVVMLASLPVGANVYLMARQFGALEGPVATSLVLTTLLAALTTPLLLAFLQ